MDIIDRQTLLEAASKSMLKLTDEQLSILSKDFEVILQQMDLISKIQGVDDVQPMIFPFDIYSDDLRDDICSLPLTADEALRNAPKIKDNQVELPKVIEK